MINSYAYDVEILPNFFSVTIIDVNSYLKTFSDCHDGSKNKKPIPLLKKYKVADVIKKLNTVKCYSYYITDKDDSQLLSMLSFFNELRPRYINNVACRSDLFGYNSANYDCLMITALLMYYNQVNTTKELITKLYETSKHIISIQHDKDIIKHDYLINTLRNFQLPYKDVDVMKIFALNKVGKGTDDKGNTVYFGKGLKQTSVNLQWYELLEYELPPISDKDVQFYNKMPLYKSIPCEKLNQLIDKWDRYIIDEWIEPTMRYNKNDVFIVCEIIRLYIDEIRLRYNISHSYEIDVVSSSRSDIANKLFIKFYSDFSGLHYSQWGRKKTERTALSFKKVIFPFIKFKTFELQDFLEELNTIILYSIGKKAIKNVADKYPNAKYLKTNTDSGWFEVKINKLIYTIATGGLHTQDIPRELKSKLNFITHPSTGEVPQINYDNIWDEITDDSYIYVHWDITSFYPSLMAIYKIAPAHIDSNTFVKLISWLKNTRIEAKHSIEEYIDGIPKDLLAQVLKIVINSIYGKLGFEEGDICDRLAVLKVTINGQLMILMLCEELELNGIEVCSANTDGIVIKLYKTKKKIFDDIANSWKKLTGLDADAEEYKCYINRDINNYIVEELNGKVSYKGAMNPEMYAVDLQKGYDMPIVAKAVDNYFRYNKPVLETLYECTDILEFCKSQNVGNQFYVEICKGTQYKPLQKYVRYYVSNTGVSLFKTNKNDNKRSNLCAGQYVTILNTLDDKDISERNINYVYYYNECLKIIDPIKLSISPNQKGDANKKTKSGKALIKKNAGCYNFLFDDAE